MWCLQECKTSQFKHFYGKMNFNLEQVLAITKSISELTDPYGSYGLVERRSRRNNRFDDGVVVLYDNERHDLPSSHNRPCYITANVKGVELKRTRLNQGSSLNIISLAVLDIVGIPRDRITRSRSRHQVSEATTHTLLIR